MKLLILLSIFSSYVAFADTAENEFRIERQFAYALVENVNGLTGNVVRYSSHCDVNTLVRENDNLLYIYTDITGCADLTSVPNAYTVLLQIDGQNIKHGDEIVGTKRGNDYFLKVNFSNDDLFVSKLRLRQEFESLCPLLFREVLLPLKELKSQYELKMTKDQGGNYTLKQSWSSEIMQVLFRKNFSAAACQFSPVVHVGKQVITIDKIVVESSR